MHGNAKKPSDGFTVFVRIVSKIYQRGKIICPFSFFKKNNRETEMFPGFQVVGLARFFSLRVMLALYRRSSQLYSGYFNSFKLNHRLGGLKKM